jgi:hypothetical protein
LAKEFTLINKKKMRQITRNMRGAFRSKTNLKHSNSEVKFEMGMSKEEDTTTLYLHGNKIVKRVGSEIYVRDAGWPTKTTRERLSSFVYGITLRQGTITIHPDFKVESKWKKLPEELYKV